MSALRHEILDRELWYSLHPPFYQLNFLDNRNFVKHRKVLLWFFLALWDKKFTIQSRDIPLLGIKFFDTRNILKPIRASHELFLECETKKIVKIVILLSSKKIRHHNTSEIQGSPRKISGTVRHKNFKRRNVISHPPPVHKIFSIPKNFWNTEGFPYEVFRSCGTRNCRQKIVIPFCKKFFRYPNFSDNRIVATFFLRYCETKKSSTENRDIKLFGIEFFDTGK